MVPSPTASRTAPSGVSSKRPANAPSEKRVANFFATVGRTRSSTCSSSGGGGVCAAQSFADVTPAERAELARALKTILLKFDRLWDKPFPYVMVAHQLLRQQAHNNFQELAALEFWIKGVAKTIT